MWTFCMRQKIRFLFFLVHADVTESAQKKRKKRENRIFSFYIRIHREKKKRRKRIVVAVDEEILWFGDRRKIS